jgi:hypothetical protein
MTLGRHPLFGYPSCEGRNRLPACEVGGVVPPFIPADLGGMWPREWVILHNLLRRHLTVAQRGALGLESSSDARGGGASADT